MAEKAQAKQAKNRRNGYRSTKCKCCQHPDLELIDDCLQLAPHYRQAAEVFGLSLDSLRRHAIHHIAKKRKPKRTKLEVETVLYGEAEALQLQAQRSRRLKDGSLQRELDAERRAAYAVRAAERRQKEKERTRRNTCRCNAYAFPHNRGKGLCRWPDPPDEIWQGELGKPSQANMRKRSHQQLDRAIARLCR